MDRTLEEKLSAFRALIQKIKSYEEALGVMYWDLRTGAPRKGVEGRSEVIGVLSTEMFRLTVSEEMNAFLDEFTLPEVYSQLDEINRKIVKESKKEYDRSKKIPPEKYQEYVVLTSQAESVWEQAKQESDFSLFRPYLEKIVKYNQEFIELWGYEGNKYNTLLDMYEPGMTVEKLDLVFGQLKDRTVPLAARIKKAKDKPDSSFLHQHYDKGKQREFSRFILKEMGYDFQAGRLDESVHPFATGLNPGDVRITTNFKPDDISFALFGTIHEGGHALYEQNLSEELRGTILCTGTSMGIHESQSRFWENFIGCSLPFWKRYYAEMQNAFPTQLGNITVEQFYRTVNEAEPSLIRIEADELTYNLHIMIRYEIEKALINDEIRVDELPEVWNAKYTEYLGVTPSRDAEGVLQDVHWSGGSFGYFPSYALGNMYAAQIMHTLRKQMPDLDAMIERGELHPVKEWLTDKIYRFGKLLDPSEIILQVTGEELNPAYLVDHLTRKYSEIYRLD
ncbi:carboxypeptidase M32 [Ferviditalea candida]|uniref:Metal-dependent carboxypeptidase n=1 Tax=Ferviditalea candida TaxID=3108399 RepID=A0ABU5ZNP0_9BACL|nr:carboxypeptidase M32 [Paenibacillaceae bacterium T2]